MSERASILIGLLWCLAILSVVVVGTLHTAEMDLLAGKNFGDKIQARYLALAGIERAEALLYKNAQDRSHSVKNHTGEFYDDAQDFQDATLGRGTYSVIRRGRDDEGGGVIYGVSDEESRLNLNNATSDELTKIPGLGPDVAAAILGWRGTGSSAAENDYYMALRPPHQPRNGPFQTIRELLMVRGVSSDQLFGRDIHQNGILDDLAGEPNEPPKYEDSLASDDLGWAADLTVDSQVKNVTATGEARVNIQDADENALAAIPGVTRDIAHAIVAYRGQHRFDSIANLLDVTPPSNNGGGGGGGGGDNSGQTVISDQLFTDIADRVTTASDQVLSGPVNLNTAGLEVLMCLPGIDRELAQAIISHRESAGFFAGIAEVLKVDGMNRQIFQQIAPLITARSETYRILAEGRVKSTGAQQRIQVIVQVNLDGVKTLSYREDNL
jgi:competence ComEA-like helix-hairpin-helix protein